MLMPHPAVLRALVDRYEAATASEPLDAAGGPGPEARDLEYTLCVSTGTRDVRAALETARRLLAASAPAGSAATGPGPLAEPAGAAC
ncbi:DUF5133 domain-containing protein [Streptomyces parvulus]|uniref:DUF5133 domain-containing protein n=1 Tax=Streptomyces parvulus TaxID=146923 RepID=A0A191UT40_9ACTN|nr:DUF5133 domain-containing protein [Streptomyces parvulus]ANJ05881.1 DUF5133 domain-containing protein [Streptomyces parvulus]GGS01298.1 hypothetical protein GCM10010220_62230 [Streptomyces parvulus]